MNGHDYVSLSSSINEDEPDIHRQNERKAFLYRGNLLDFDSGSLTTFE
jgi:hypothetical protein